MDKTFALEWNAGMKPINTSIYDFPTLIKNGFVYVDKTALIYELAKRTGDYVYFLPRPRRFGKSLLLSTLKTLFRGECELFRGLAIQQTDWDWEHEIYPVLHLDMSTVRAPSAQLLEQNLSMMIKLACEEFGASYDSELRAATNLEILFRFLKSISPNNKFVLLIDEYDAPISGLLDSSAGRRELDKIRDVLHNFYVIAKANCSDIRFLMVTGVSRFAKTSIFSGFNNPCDLAFDRRAAALLGYTHEEVELFFHEHIQAFANEQGKSYRQAFDELLAWYDGYQFCPSLDIKVVNPVSFGNALKNREIRNYWEDTAGSTLIYDALKARNQAPGDVAGRITMATLDSADALTAPVTALLYQGGYLTIDSHINGNAVTVKIPNLEVKYSLQRGYISSLLGQDFEVDAFQFTAEDTAAELAENGFTDSFQVLLRSAYAKLPHDWICKNEAEAKRYFLAFMVFARADVAGEPQHATGRPDAVLKTAKGIYIFEFKFASSAGEALRQCRERNYASRYEGDVRPVFYVGINYNPSDNVRNVDEVACEVAR